MNSSKMFLPILFLCICTGISFGQDRTKVFAETSIVWYGIDYSLAKFTLVNKSAVEIKEDYIPAINALIVQDQKKYIINKFFNKNSVDIELGNININNQKIDPAKLIRNSPNSINYKDIENLISLYDTGGKTGMGLVFIAENMNKVTAVGSFYICFFDLATKEIIDSKRMEGKATGVGFRNFWASTVYAVMRDWSPRQ